MSPEEFFMYLTIGLIILIPVGARLYRYLTANRVTRLLQEQFADTDSGPGAPRAGGNKQADALRGAIDHEK